jgi:hypothetical protein
MGPTFYTISSGRLPVFVGFLVGWRLLSHRTGRSGLVGLLLATVLTASALLVSGLEGALLVALAVSLPLVLFVLLAQPRLAQPRPRAGAKHA